MVNIGTAEIVRDRGRFASIIGALSLITFLVLTLSALADGLFYGSTGAVRSSTANAYAFSKSAEGSLVRSQLPAADARAFAQRPGVEAASPMGLLLTAGRGPSGELDLAVVGIPAGGVGQPANVVEGELPREPGTAAVDKRLTDQGVSVGSTLEVGGVAVRVTGIVADSAYQLQPTVWTDVDTWAEMRAAVRPEFRGQTGVVNAVALRVASPEDPSALSAAAIPGTVVLSATDTGLAIPGVAQQKSTLNSIIYTTLIVAAVVVALFFALLVLEKRELFAALKALGASTGSLARAVITQAFIASVLGAVIGAVVSRLVALILPAEVPALFRTGTLVSIVVFTVIAGVVGAAFSLRRISSIDPATALGGSL